LHESFFPKNSEVGIVVLSRGNLDANKVNYLLRVKKHVMVWIWNVPRRLLLKA
jgi:hypothetical protein